MSTKTRKELAGELECSIKQFNKWIQPISERLGIKPYQHFFTPKQVEAIREFLVSYKD